MSTHNDERSSPYDLDLADRLETEFDDESVQSAMDKIASNKSGKIDFVVLRALLDGRGGTLRWPHIQQLLVSDPTLSKLALLSDYAPRSYVDKLLAAIKVDDTALLEEIRSGGFPSVRVLPKTDRDRISEMLQSSVAANSSQSGTAIVLQYLLDFDNTTMRDRQSSQETIDLASQWCFQFPDHVDIEPVLSRLLYQSNSNKLLEIAQQRFKSYKSKDEAWYLLSALLNRKETRKADLMRRWLSWNEPSVHDRWILAEWLRTSNCNRKALLSCRRSLAEDPHWMLVRAIAPFARRKSVRRWFYKFLKRSICNGSLDGSIHAVVRYTPTRKIRALARIAAENADATDRTRILVQMAKSHPKEAMPMILQIVQNFPNASDSFDLMCAAAIAEPRISVPWIREWIETALPIQKTQGLLTILQIDGPRENVEEAHEWYWKISKEGLPVYWWQQLELLTQLITLDPTDDLLDEARAILGRTHDKTRPSARKLASCVQRARAR